jgi:hypothetical protein
MYWKYNLRNKKEEEKIGKFWNARKNNMKKKIKIRGINKRKNK